MKEALNAESGIQDLETGRRLLREFEPGMIRIILQRAEIWRSYRYG
jgi:hypothetical protein